VGQVSGAVETPLESDGGETHLLGEARKYSRTITVIHKWTGGKEYMEDWEHTGSGQGGMVNNGGPGYLAGIGDPHTGTRYQVPGCRTRTLSL
jgi:hypothetical protein